MRGSRVDGLKSLGKKFDRLPIDARREVWKALVLGGGDIEDSAKLLVRKPTGEVYRDIDSGVLPLIINGEDVGAQALIWAGPDPKGLERTPDSEAYYARWLEFGTQKNPAQPFLFPAYRLNRRRVLGRITRGVNKATKITAARAG